MKNLWQIVFTSYILQGFTLYVVFAVFCQQQHEMKTKNLAISTGIASLMTEKKQQLHRTSRTNQRNRSKNFQVKKNNMKCKFIYFVFRFSVGIFLHSLFFPLHSFAIHRLCCCAVVAQALVLPIWNKDDCLLKCLFTFRTWICVFEFCCGSFVCYSFA